VNTDAWKAKVMRNGIDFTFDHEATSREECLDWAHHRVAEFRAADDAEAQAETIQL
jgi:hypothetical protein